MNGLHSFRIEIKTVLLSSDDLSSLNFHSNKKSLHVLTSHTEIVDQIIQFQFQRFMHKHICIKYFLLKSVLSCIRFQISKTTKRFGENSTAK